MSNDDKTTCDFNVTGSRIPQSISFPTPGNGSGGAGGGSGSGCPECDEVRATRAGILRDGAEAVNEAAIFGAKEAGKFAAGGFFGKILGRIVGFFRFGTNKVSFGRNADQFSHTFRHIERAGLNQNSVQRAVQADLRHSASRIQTGRPFNQTIEVDGNRITYTAYRLEDGTINVGRIIIPE